MINRETEDIDHFFNLLEKYQSGKANSAEAGFVERYLQLLEKRSAIPERFDSIKKQVYNDIKGRLLHSVAKESKLSSLRPLRPLQRYWWIAASVTVLLTVGGYLFFNQSIKGPQQQTAVLADAQPGKNGAILTLANGHHVLLDSISNGTVVVAGGAKLQMQDGALLYDSTGSRTEAEINIISTPKGRQFRVVLPDGTTVWLNAASSLTYPTRFDGRERRVTVSGEAFFEVARREQQPFKIKINERTEVQVLGTSFNINAYYDEAAIKTTLLSGSLKVVNGQSDKLLRPGQQAVIDAGSRDITVQQANTEDVVAWKNGSFAFVNADLESVMRQLARWYDITVKFEGEMPEGTFSGEIDRTLTLTQVLNGLASTRIHYQLLPGNKLIIRP